jgi:ornithine carbamoyltransferase
MPSLISLGDLSAEEVRALVKATGYWARNTPRSEALLGDQVIGLYFAQPSTRTRTSFSTAALRLGARIISYGPSDLQLSTGETDTDTGMVLATMLDALVVRAGTDHGGLLRLSAGGRLPVVNAMNSIEHPTQAIGDLATIERVRGSADGVQVLYIGEVNSTTVALALALSRFDRTLLHVVAPPGYGFGQEMLSGINALGEPSGSRLLAHDHPSDVDAPVDFVYTTQWQTTGMVKADPDWHRIFYPDFQVNAELMARWPNASFMHDLPARRGEEVTSEVLDGPLSLAPQQVRNKLNSALAVLLWISGRYPGGIRR